MSAYFAARRGLRSPDGLLLAGREGASDLSGPGRPVALPPTRHYAVREDLSREVASANDASERLFTLLRVLSKWAMINRKARGTSLNITSSSRKPSATASGGAC